MARLEGEWAWWPLMVGIMCLVIAFEALWVLRWAADGGSILVGTAGLAGAVFLCLDRVKTRGLPGEPPPFGVAWWPFAVAMAMFVVALPMAYWLRDPWELGVVASLVIISFGVVVLAVGKDLSRALVRRTRSRSSERVAAEAALGVAWPLLVGILFVVAGASGAFAYRRVWWLAAIAGVAGLSGAIGVLVLGKALESARRQRGVGPTASIEVRGREAEGAMEVGGPHREDVGSGSATATGGGVMAARDERTARWLWGVFVGCVALGIASPILFRDAWDHGLLLGLVTMLAGVPYLFAGKRLVVAEPAPAPVGRTLWWPFVVGMLFLAVAVTAPFAYRRVIAAGLLVTATATLGGVGTMYLGKVLMRTRSSADGRR